MKHEKAKRLKCINRDILKRFLLLSALLVILIEFTCYLIVAQTSTQIAKDRLISVGRETAMLLKNGNDPTDYMFGHGKDGIIVYVLSPAGDVLLPSGQKKPQADITKIIEKLDNAERFSPVIYPENNALNYVMPLKYQGESYLLATYSLDMHDKSIQRILSYFVVVGVLVLALTAIIAYNLSQGLSSGLKTLSSTAVRFSKGDFGVNFANAEYQELADLCDTLNSVRDEVKKSGDFQRELIANVSHDFKTPLTMIKAYASMIREISGDNKEKREKHLQVIIDEADRLTGIVNDVLNVSKLSANLDEIKAKVFNLTEFLFGILNKFDYLQQTQGYSFMIDVDPNLYTRADEEQIGQVIYNLFGNAVNYTGDDKTVYISLKNVGERIKLAVRDTGKGISRQDLPQIWNRYYRAKETHTRPVKGTGLGLNIVKIILEKHSFDFGVESEAGKGSTFWVDFPAVPENID